jgi:hypothetical protein
VKADDKAANGVIWHNDIVKADDKAVNGVIWHNDNVKADNNVANGVIWHNDSLKADDNLINGVIWHNDNVKADDKAATGVIWHTDIVTNSKDKKSQGVTWNSVTEVTHAQTAANDSEVSHASPRMKLIKKWAVENIDNSEIASNNAIRLEL